MKFIYIILFCSLLPKVLLAQEPATTSTVSTTPPDTVEEYEEPILHGDVTIKKDPRIENLIQRQRQLNTVTTIIKSMQGYRVQIYNGNDRIEAMRIKTEFIRNYPRVRSYLNYSAPYFKIRVGDFKTRQEALPLLKQVYKQFNGCFTVPDVVNIQPEVLDPNAKKKANY